MTGSLVNDGSGDAPICIDAAGQEHITYHFYDEARGGPLWIGEIKIYGRIGGSR